MKKRCLEIVAGLIKRDGTYLLAQRMADDAYGSLWEFPGGKIETGETPQQALRREMAEELGDRCCDR
jgi:ADP-ribose pyrophosphatase